MPFKVCIRSCHFLARNSSHPIRGKPTGPCRPPWLLPPAPLCWPCPSRAGRLLLQRSGLQGHLRVAAQASRWPGRRAHVARSLPSSRSLLKHCLLSYTPGASSCSSHSLRPRTPGLLVLPLLFLPHSLYRNLAGRVFAALPNLSVSPGEGSFKLVSFSAVASVLGMVLGI